MKVLVCGSRTWQDWDPIHRELERLNQEHDSVTVIHGAARGADTIAGQVATNLGMDVIACPADWGRLGRKAGPIRNKRMLEQYKPDLVLAFSSDFANSRGTSHMIQIAEAAGVKVLRNGA